MVVIKELRYFLLMQTRNLKLLATTCFISILAACKPALDTENNVLELPSAALKMEQSVPSAYNGVLSNNGQYSMMSINDNVVSLWNTQEQGALFNWIVGDKNSQSPAYILKITYDNSYALTARQHDFTIWDIGTGKPLGFWEVGNNTIRDMAIATQASAILIAQSNNTIQHISLPSGRRLEFLGHTNTINSVDISPQGKFALSGGSDYQAYLWNTATAQILYTFPHSQRVTYVTLDPLGRYALTVDAKQGKIWSLNDGKLIATLPTETPIAQIATARFNAAGTQLLTGSTSQLATLWEVTSGRQLKQWKISTRENTYARGAIVYSVAFDANEEHIITNSSAGYVEKWSIN